MYAIRSYYDRQSRAIALLLAAQPLSYVLGAPISGAKAPAVPLPVAQTTFKGRDNRKSPTRSSYNFV